MAGHLLTCHIMIVVCWFYLSNKSDINVRGTSSQWLVWFGSMKIGISLSRIFDFPVPGKNKQTIKRIIMEPKVKSINLTTGFIVALVLVHCLLAQKNQVDACLNRETGRLLIRKLLQDDPKLKQYFANIYKDPSANSANSSSPPTTNTTSDSNEGSTTIGP